MEDECSDRCWWSWKRGTGPINSTLALMVSLSMKIKRCTLLTAWNHRIVSWKTGATTGEVLAGGKDEGNRLDQLNHPTDVIVDRETDSLLICDRGNRRVMRWPRRPHLSTTTTSNQGQIVIDNIDCYGVDDGRSRFSLCQ